MCEKYTPCVCLTPQKPPPKTLTLLLLDCWQREYTMRPYKLFVFRRAEFEERMRRSFDPLADFEVVVRFLQQRTLYHVKLTGLDIVPHNREQHALLHEFAASLGNLLDVELKLMDLPTKFFKLLCDNCSRMHLHRLSLEGSPLSTEALTELRSFLIASRTLVSLNVSHCSITQHNFALLADGVHKSSSLRSFKGNRLLGGMLTLDSTKTAHTLSSLLWQNKLTKLVMRQCEFISSDMEVVAEYLRRTQSKLQKLDLSCNLIGPDGAEFLFRAIAHSGTLTHLNISRNGLGSHGGEVVARYMTSCYRLVCLDISHNAIGYEAMNAILTAMKKEVDWASLKLYGNEFGAKSANILRRLLSARVLPQDKIDITVTFDETLSDYRVIPRK